MSLLLWCPQGQAATQGTEVAAPSRQATVPPWPPVHSSSVGSPCALPEQPCPALPLPEWPGGFSVCRLSTDPGPGHKARPPAARSPPRAGHCQVEINACRNLKWGEQMEENRGLTSHRRAEDSLDQATPEQDSGRSWDLTPSGSSVDRVADTERVSSQPRGAQ